MSRILSILSIVTMLGVTGCAHNHTSPAGASKAALTGTVSYRERIALSPDAVVDIRLDDVSGADATAQTLAKRSVPTKGKQVPIPFTLVYNPDRINPKHRYVVQAEIRERGKLRWTTDKPVPVLTRGAPPHVSVRVVQAAHSSAARAGMAPQEAGRTLVFECNSSKGGNFSFTERTGPGEAALWLPERLGGRYLLVLGQTRAASGARYEGDGVVFWNKGDEALLEVNGDRFTGCVLDRQRSTWEGARLSGVGFRATGQEPGRQLEIHKGMRMRFEYAYGQREVTTPAPRPTEDPKTGRTVYHAKTEAHDLKVTIADGICTDSMSGQSFDKRVSVKLDGKVYRGCGRAL